MKLPQYFGHLTNDLIWRRIAPGLLKALKERRHERGTPSNKLHLWTSEELGRPELLLHLGTVIGLMKLHTDYDEFHKQLDKIAPIYPDNPTLFDDPRLGTAELAAVGSFLYDSHGVLTGVYPLALAVGELGL